MNDHEKSYLRVGYGHVFVRFAFLPEFMAHGWTYAPRVGRVASGGVWLFKSIPEVEIVRA